MSSSIQRKRPAAATVERKKNNHTAPSFYPYGHCSAYLPHDWRERVAALAPAYYQARIERLGKPSAQGWAQPRCSFYDDHHESLAVNLITGRWRCLAGCGCGDLLSFHCRATGLDFKPAVRDLLGLH
ncbi:MAG TPA: hypothetical protein VFQ88_04640 [Nevskiaceae bacterium]|nr:hypothetical protein [Nevskiaceae bacterium]